MKLKYRMARTIKKFQTEEEYQEWVKSPYMRTPYTCLVKETGQMHYFDGDDNDYSITATIRKTGWIKLGTPALIKYIDKVYRNGEELDLDDVDVFPNHKSSSYYYRKEKLPYGEYNYWEQEDYAYTAVMTIECHERGGLYYNSDTILNYVPRRFARGHVRNSRDRFFYVKKDDVIKIVFSTNYVLTTEWYSLLFGADNSPDAYSSPMLPSLNKWAKEFVVGDGFTKINGWLLRSNECKKVYMGKNVKTIYNPQFLVGNYYKQKFFIRKDAEIISEDEDFGGKIVRI